AGARRLHRRGERGGPRRLRERLPAAQGDVALVLRARCSGEILMSRSTLLIVEDQEEMSHFLQEELREAGYEVIVTATGLEALDHLEIGRASCREGGEVAVVVGLVIGRAEG